MSETIRILLLEDIFSDVELTRATLQAHGIKFELKDVSSGMEFAAAVQSFVPDVVISDYSLPGYDGAKALSPAHTFHLFLRNRRGRSSD